MNICKYCKNNIRKEALYCDQCGKLLDFKIYVKFKKEFDDILDGLISNLEKTDDGFLFTTLLENFIILFWNYLDEESNLKDVAKNDKITLYHWENNFPLNTAFKLKDVPKNSRNTMFIIELNEKYDEYKNSLNKREYEFIYFTNINNNNIDKNFNQTLELFNLDIIKFKKIEKYLIESKMYQQLDNNLQNRIILTNKTKGKDLDYQYGLSFDNIYGFLGLLTLINNYNKTTRIIGNLKNDFKLIDFNIVCETICINDNFIESQEDLIYKLRNINSKLSNEKISIKEVFIEKYENHNLTKELKIYLSLYYLASIEKDLSNSFIKYWTLSERIIKDSVGYISNNKLIKLMKNILIICGFPECVLKQIKYIEKKRNKFVHKLNFDIIEQSDRNLAKSISEKLLGFLILSDVKINNMNDFGYLLEYYNQKNEIKRIEKLLEELN